MFLYGFRSNLTFLRCEYVFQYLLGKLLVDFLSGQVRICDDANEGAFQLADVRLDLFRNNADDLQKAVRSLKAFQLRLVS